MSILLEMPKEVTLYNNDKHPVCTLKQVMDQRWRKLWKYGEEELFLKLFCLVTNYIFEKSQKYCKKRLKNLEKNFGQPSQLPSGSAAYHMF